MFYLECQPDKILVTALDVPENEITHAYGKGNVCIRLKKNRNSTALVDEDPLSAQPSYIKKLKLISEKDGIKYLYDEDNQNHLIILCPRLEEWILAVVKETQIAIADYDLPGDADQLHRTVNIKPKNLKNLIEDTKGKSRMLKTLAGYIRGN